MDTSQAEPGAEPNTINKSIMKNEEIINAFSVLSTVLKAAKLDYKPADLMIEALKKNPVFQESEMQRAFCAGFICNLKTMADFDGERIVSKYDSFKNSGFFKY